MFIFLDERLGCSNHGDKDLICRWIWILYGVLLRSTSLGGYALISWVFLITWLVFACYIVYHIDGIINVWNTY